MHKETEEWVRKNKRLRREEEEEDMEISEYYQRLEYMRDSSGAQDCEIGWLIEEQQGMLNLLCMKKNEFSDNFL